MPKPCKLVSSPRTATCVAQERPRQPGQGPIGRGTTGLKPLCSVRWDSSGRLAYTVEGGWIRLSPKGIGAQGSPHSKVSTVLWTDPFSQRNRCLTLSLQLLKRPLGIRPFASTAPAGPT